MPIGSLRLVTGSSYRAARRRETRALRAQQFSVSGLSGVERGKLAT